RVPTNDLPPEQVGVDEAGADGHRRDARAPVLLAGKDSVSFDAGDAGNAAQHFADIRAERRLQPPAFGSHADTTRSPVRMNQLRSDSRKLRATDEMAMASARLRAMTAVVTPVRPGERIKLSAAILPSKPKALGITRRRSRVVQFMSGIEMTTPERDQ